MVVMLLHEMTGLGVYSKNPNTGTQPYAVH